MAAEDWLDAARMEFNELNANAALTAADAWRVLALASRLAARGSSALEDQRVTELLAVVAPVPPKELLDELWASLAEARQEPDEALLVLLDIDDRAGIETLTGNLDVAVSLATRAAGLVSLYPANVLELADFAAMRLECFAGSHPTQAVWHAVAEAAAQQLADALPTTVEAAPKPALVARLIASRPARTWTPILLDGGRTVRPLGQLDNRLLRVAAATPESVSSPVQDAAGRVIGWVYPSPESGRPTLELRLDDPPSDDLRVALVITDAAGNLRASRDVDVEVDGAEVYADLSGARAGSAGLLAELLADSGLAPDDAHLRVGLHD